MRILFDQSYENYLMNYEYSWVIIVHIWFGQNCAYLLVSKFGRNFDQTSTPVSKFGRVWVETSTKLRHPPVSKFGRSVLDILLEHIVKSRCLSNVDQTSTPNFDTPSVEVRSKFRPNVDQTSTRHLGVEVWSNCGYVLVKIVDICWSEL